MKLSADNRILVGFLIVVVTLLLVLGGNTSSSVLFAMIAIIGSQEIERTQINRSIPNKFLHLTAATLPCLLFLHYGLGDTALKILIGTSLVFNLHLALDLFAGWKFPYREMSKTFTLLYLGLPLGALITILLNSKEAMWPIIISIIVLIWTCDTMAYFVGRSLGKNKLFPSVSPKKTIEGSLGAGISAVIVSMIIARLLEQETSFWILLSIIVWIGSTVGDLVESKFKRIMGIKDSGTILRGHGGILDRYDSLIYIIPFVLAYFGLYH